MRASRRLFGSVIQKLPSGPAVMLPGDPVAADRLTTVTDPTAAPVVATRANRLMVAPPLWVGPAIVYQTSPSGPRARAPLTAIGRVYWVTAPVAASTRPRRVESRTVQALPPASDASR